MDATDFSGRQINQYRLLHKIGDGGFGAVYLAKHVKNETHVAVKLLFLPLNTKTISDFINEAKFGLFQHPNIVRIRDFGIDHGYPYFIMNYLKQGSLRDRHPFNSLLPWPTVTLYARQVAEAMQYIHDNDIVHRDIKPGNLLISDNDDIQISDFGIAVISYTDNEITQIPRGSLHYLAPEQIHGHARSASDQYALGVIMYEWLTGRPPFVGTQTEVIAQHLQAQPVSLRKKEPLIPLEVDLLVMQMLNKDPEARFKSMREFIIELERVNVSPVPILSTPFTKHEEAVQSLSWSRDGKYIVSAGKAIHVWEAATKHILYTYYGHTRDIWSVAWSPNNKYIVSSGEDEVIHVWEAATGYIVMSYAEHLRTVRSVGWSPTGKFIASAGDDAVVQVWEMDSGQSLTTYRQHGERVLCLAWSPDGTYIASGGNDCVVRVWEAATGNYRSLCRGHIDRVTSVAWSPDGAHIASASDDGTILVWEAATGRQLAVYTGHNQAVTSVAWSPNSSYLASSSWDKTVRVWDVESRTCLMIDESHTQWVNAVAWSPNGKYIASASWDTTVCITPFEVSNVTTVSV